MLIETMYPKKIQMLQSLKKMSHPHGSKKSVKFEIQEVDWLSANQEPASYV